MAPYVGKNDLDHMFLPSDLNQIDCLYCISILETTEPEEFTVQEQEVSSYRNWTQRLFSKPPTISSKKKRIGTKCSLYSLC